MHSPRAGLETNPFISILQLKFTVAAVLLLLFLNNISSVRAAPAPVANHCSVRATRPCCGDSSYIHSYGRYEVMRQGVAEESQFTLDSSEYIHTGLLQHHDVQSSIPILQATHRHKISREPVPLNERNAPGTDTEVVVLVRRKSIAAKIRDAFHKLGRKIKHAFQKVGHAIKTGFQKFGHAIKTAAQKVGHFIKTTGAKIAKVGLKIAATIGKGLSKVIGWIPGAKGLGKALEYGSEGLNKASDAIHVHIGGKLGTAMERMSKAQKYMGYIP